MSAPEAVRLCPREPTAEMIEARQALCVYRNDEDKAADADALREAWTDMFDAAPATPPLPGDVGGLVERLERLLSKARLAILSMPGEPAYPLEVRERDSARDSLKDYEAWVPKVIAALASYAAEREEMIDLIEDAWGALNFILAFYEPGQRYLDTEAWKTAEADGRDVHARLEALLAKLRPTEGEGA